MTWDRRRYRHLQRYYQPDCSRSLGSCKVYV